MSEQNYDDPAVEEEWCQEQRELVIQYLQSQNVDHGRVGEWPAWYIPPYVSVWAVESLTRPERIGWWVICGDLPTDYISAADVESPQHPRKAIRLIADRWLRMVHAWHDGQEIEETRIVGTSSRAELGPLLKRRAELLLKWADDDFLWEDDQALC